MTTATLKQFTKRILINLMAVSLVFVDRTRDNFGANKTQTGIFNGK